MITVWGIGVEDLGQAVPLLAGSDRTRISDVVASEDLIHAGSRRDPADRRRLLAGRAALRLLVTHVRGEAPVQADRLPIDRTCPRCGAGHGRPRLPGLSLSSSSTAGAVLVGVGRSSGRIGVDLERIPATITPGFDGYALHPAERERFAAEPSPRHGYEAGYESGHQDLVEQRMALWVLKEAVLKAAGIGLDHPPEDLLLGPTEAHSTWHSGDGVRVLTWHRVLQAQDEGVAGLWVCLVPCPPGYRGAVAASAPQDLHDAGAAMLGHVPAPALDGACPSRR